MIALIRCRRRRCCRRHSRRRPDRALAERRQRRNRSGASPLPEERGVRVSVQSGPEVNPLWASGFSRDVLLVPLCWKDILINAVTVLFEKEFLLPYGVFYRPEPNPAAPRFLDFIVATYCSGNGKGIVPVLE